MTRPEKVAALQAKAADLLKYFEGKTLPQAPFKIKPWATILDADKFIKKNTDLLEGNHDNPFSRVYVMAYFHLMDLKNYMDEHFPINSKSGPGDDPANAGN